MSEKLLKVSEFASYQDDIEIEMDAKANADASNVDPADWADVVSAAIDGDPAMFRTSLKVDTGIASPSFMAILNKMLTVGGEQATVHYLGDSLGERSMNPLYGHLKDHFPISGYALDRLKTLVASGTVVAPGANGTPNYQPTMIDGGRVWNMSSGAVLNVGLPLGGAGYQEFRCSKAVFWCAKQPGGGTITVEYQRDGSTWVAPSGNTVSTDGTAGEIARVEITLPSLYWAKFRVTSSVGPVNYLGAKIWDHLGTGLILSGSANGGTQFTQSNLASAAIRTQIGTDLGPGIIITDFAEGIAEVDQTKVDIFLDNWHTAMPTSDMLLIEQIGVNSRTDAVHSNGIYKVAASTRPWVNIAPVEDWLRGEDYITDKGYDSPDSVHLDDEVWMAVGGKVYSELFAPLVPDIELTQVSLTGNTQEFQFGALPISPNYHRRYLMPVDRAADGYFGVVTRNSSGTEAGAGLMYFGTGAALPQGVQLIMRCDAGFRTPITCDNQGRTTLGPYNATPQSAYANGGGCYIWEESASRAALVVNHTSASATVLQVWKHQGTVRAEMREDGELNLKTITTAADYADDAAAATAGIPVGGIYRKTGGTVVWRQA